MLEIGAEKSKQMARQMTRQMTEQEPLTKRQQEILDLIRATVASRGYPPSVREIGEAVGLSSPSSVHSHLSSLVEYGYLRRDPSKPRAIEVVDQHPPLTKSRVRDVPLVGHVAAGSPILAEQHIDDVFPLPESLVGTGPVFMLRVRGDSMIEDGILDGDLVVIESREHARNGEIVVALVDGGEATLKRIVQRPGEIELWPANGAMEPLRFAPERVQIQGVVIGQMRTYR